MSRFKTLEVSDPRFEADYLRHVTVKSESLHGRGDITLFVPPGSSALKDLPIVTLLHGVYGSHWGWALQGGAHRSALKLMASRSLRPMVLAMPSDGLWGDGSAYHAHHGADFEAWVLEEVPAAVAEVLPQASAASPRFIAGLSMGGFGALRLGAKHPGRFRAFSSHSAVTELSQLQPFVAEDLGDTGPADTVLAWMLKNQAALPPFRFDCGSADELVHANRRLSQDLQAAGIAHVYQEFPGGHEWSYWQEHLKDSLLFFEKALKDAA